jgi:predicted nucleic acid-binding protein
MNSPFFLDANVIMYSLGSSHPCKEPCKNILEKIKLGDIRAVTNTEVLQEILHRYFSLGKPDIAEIGYASMIHLCLTIFPVTLAETNRALELMKTNPAITSRDAIHAATMINNGVKEIISTDSHFDIIPGINRIDPARWR